MKKMLTAMALIFFAITSFSQRTLIAPINTQRIFPQWVGGDRDFWGHGPRVFGDVRVEVSQGKAQIIAFINLTMEETEGDKSTATIDETRLIYSAPAGKQIKAIIVPTSLNTHFDFKLSRGGLSRMNATRGGPVSHLMVNGDGESKDIGNNTNDDSHITVYFAGMVIELEPLPSGMREISLSKSVFGGVLRDKLNGTTGKINTYGPRHGDSWFKERDSWIKFPNEIRRDTMFLSDLREILISPRRYNYNEIRLQSIGARPNNQYLQISVNWESDGPELRGECVNDIGCGFGSPSVQLDDLKILINVRPAASGGNLTYDSKDIQVEFSYKFGADCGILSDLCKEIFKDPLESSLFRSRFLMAAILRADVTRNEIAGALTSGVLNYVRTIGGFPAASQILDVRDNGNNMVVRCR